MTDEYKPTEEEMAEYRDSLKNHFLRDKLNEAMKSFGFSGIHPALELIPLMTEQEYQALIKDVKKHGFIEPISITSDKILLDGRCRLCASIELCRNVKIEYCNPVDAIAYIMGKNVLRKQLTSEEKKEMDRKAAEAKRPKQMELFG
jgi:hypothetical protein